MWRATTKKSQTARRERMWEEGNVHERCRCETYCSRTHRSGRDSPALHHTDNLPGCRCDRSGIQTAQEHTCHRGPWWLQTFSPTLITRKQRHHLRVQSLITHWTFSLISLMSHILFLLEQHEVISFFGFVHFILWKYAIRWSETGTD